MELWCGGYQRVLLELCSYQPKKYRQSATSKNSTLVPAATVGCLLEKKLAEYPRVVPFDQVDPFWRDTIPMECKDNQFKRDGFICISNIKPYCC